MGFHGIIKTYNLQLTTYYSVFITYVTWAPWSNRVLLLITDCWLLTTCYLQLITYYLRYYCQVVLYTSNNNPGAVAVVAELESSFPDLTGK